MPRRQRAALTRFDRIQRAKHTTKLEDGEVRDNRGSDPQRRSQWAVRRGMTKSALSQTTAGAAVDALIAFTGADLQIHVAWGTGAVVEGFTGLS